MRDGFTCPSFHPHWWNSGQLAHCNGWLANCQSQPNFAALSRRRQHTHSGDSHRALRFVLPPLPFLAPGLPHCLPSAAKLLESRLVRFAEIDVLLAYIDPHFLLTPTACSGKQSAAPIKEAKGPPRPFVGNSAWVMACHTTARKSRPALVPTRGSAQTGTGGLLELVLCCGRLLPNRTTHTPSSPASAVDRDSCAARLCQT